MFHCAPRFGVEPVHRAGPAGDLGQRRLLAPDGSCRVRHRRSARCCGVPARRRPRHGTAAGPGRSRCGRRAKLSTDEVADRTPGVLGVADVPEDVGDLHRVCDEGERAQPGEQLRHAGDQGDGEGGEAWPPSRTCQPARRAEAWSAGALRWTTRTGTPPVAIEARRVARTSMRPRAVPPLAHHRGGQLALQGHMTRWISGSWSRLAAGCRGLRSAGGAASWRPRPRRGRRRAVRGSPADLARSRYSARRLTVRPPELPGRRR